MSKLTLVIGNKNYSSWSLRPWLLLKHHGLEFEEKKVFLYKESSDAALAGYNSDHKVPVLQDGELMVWDSLAILEYLSEQYLQGGGWPVEYKARAMARSMSNEMHSSFASLRNEMPMSCRHQYPGISISLNTEQDIERIKSLWLQCRRQYANEGEWLFGEFSIADAMYAPVVLRFYGYGVAVDDPVRQYMQQVLNHPAMQEWIEAGRQEKEIIDWAEIDPARIVSSGQSGDRR